MTTLDFLYKVQYRGRLENPRQAKQAIELVFTVLKERLSQDPSALLNNLSDDIKILWRTTAPAIDGKDWYTQLDTTMRKNGFVVNTREIIKAVLLTLRDALDKSSARKLSIKLPEDFRMYLAGC